MILHHLKSFFQDKKNIMISTSMALASSIITGASVHFLEKNQNSCEVNKPAFVFFKNSDLKQGILLKINQEEIQIQQESEDNPFQSFPLNEIQKIIFFSDSTAMEEELYQKPQLNSSFAGKYSIIAGGHKGFLVIYLTTSGLPAGYIHFPHWGKGKIEYLSYVELNQNTIKFIRHCWGEHCKEIGAGYSFKQTYTGNFIDKNTIEGKYSGTHSSGMWKAIRIE